MASELQQSSKLNTKQIYLSIVIPVYNEDESLLPLMDQLIPVLDNLKQSYEIVFIDDGSTDNSLNILKEFVQTRPNIVVIEQLSNLGKSAALNAGFNVAHGQIIITMDADLQDEPREIPKLLGKLNEGYDLVTGLRENRWSNDPLGKTLPSRVANTVTRVLSGVPLYDMNSGFKCYRSRVVKQIYLHSDLHRYIPVLAYYRGFKVTEVPVEQHPRQYGYSKYGPSRFLRSFFDLVTVLFLSRFRYRPLHLFGGIGLVSSVIGFIISLYLSFVWLFTDTVIGDRPLLLLGVLLIIVGIQFISIGLIADLVVSIDRNREDPKATVREIYFSET